MPIIGETKKQLFLCPNGGFKNLIYVGSKCKKGVLNPHPTCAKSVSFWEINEANNGWITHNPLMMDIFWNGGGVGNKFPKKNIMNKEEFMNWYADTANEITNSYWCTNWCAK